MMVTSQVSWGTERGFTRLCDEIGLKLEPFQKRLAREVFSGRRELLVLIPRGNGKTTLFAALALYHLIVVPDARVYLAAASVNQASLAYGVIGKFVRNHPKLERNIDMLPGYSRIDYKRNGGEIKVLSSDAPKAFGLQPTLVLIDELHAHESDDLYVALKTALGKRDEAQLVTISTAGFHQERVLYRLREAFHELSAEPNDDPRLRVARNKLANSVMFEWAADETDDLSDPTILKLCNPATFVSSQFLGEQIASPGLTEWECARYHANVWTPTFASWLPPGAWEGCYEPNVAIPDEAKITLGVDIGLRRDTSAVVAVHQREDLRWVVEATIWKPPGGDDALNLELVEQRIRQWRETHDVELVAFDKWGFYRSAMLLEEEGLLMQQAAINNAYTVPAWARLHEAIARREIVHDGDAILAAHVGAGIKMDTERGWRITKAKAKRPIDGLFALMLAFTEAGGATWDGPMVEVFG